MRTRIALLAAASVVALAACSVVDDGKVSNIDPPDGLTDTRPATTTTTIVESTVSSGPTTSTTLVQSEPVRLYFIVGSTLSYVTVQIPTPVLPFVIISTLQKGPPGDLVGMRTALPRDVVISVETDDSGVASVELPDDFFDRVSGGDQKLAIAQIVLTLTDNRGIGQVIFNQPVLKPLGEFVAAGEPLSRRDFAPLAGSVDLADDKAAATSSTGA
ncbi:MAG TPA: GerMN domain-containing protein [Ilumatobacteraceae bacterium]|nr:GerMN domain-containing protein [Ilumatobacteraceae bacterium]